MNAETIETTVTLRGQVYGTLWMGAVDAWQDFKLTYTVGRDIPFHPRYLGIRDMFLHVRDGDFQGAAIDNCDLVIDQYRYHNGCAVHTSYTRYDFRPAHHLDCFTPEQAGPFGVGE